jgi:hypothetical protein
LALQKRKATPLNSKCSKPLDPMSKHLKLTCPVHFSDKAQGITSQGVVEGVETFKMVVADWAEGEESEEDDKEEETSNQP